MFYSKSTVVIILVGLLLTILLITQKFLADKVDYNQDVKPIINQHCISCHGGVKANGGFSLLKREWALQSTDSGKPAIIPGHADSSEMIRRLHETNTDDRMPLHKNPLSQSEIEILTDWINQGAKWGVHWAYQPLEKSQFTNVVLGSSESAIQKHALHNRIDHWIVKGLEDQNLKMNPTASNAELIRRMSLDITGLPPTPEIQKKYLTSNNYEGLIDELLSSESFGEHWASMWLDVARYADSKGFERDANRSIWRYRDYVIKSLNDDKPYDTFITEQIAGDLLKNPSDEQLIATGFHRNTTTNDEGGTNNEEYRIRAVMDRVATTWSGLMSTTMACVQCHSHPYDPITHEEYYQSFAFFNNTRDYDTHKDYPILQFLDTVHESNLEDLKNWITTQPSQLKATDVERLVRTIQPVIYSIEADSLNNAALYDTKYLGIRKNGWARIKNIELTGHSHLLTKASIPKDKGWLDIHIDQPNGPLIGQIYFQDKSEGQYQLIEIPIEAPPGTHDLYLKYRNKNISLSDMGIQFDWFHLYAGFPSFDNKERYWNIFSKLLLGSHDHTLIMIDNPEDRRRKTYVYDRGNWKNPTQEVRADIPDILPPLNAEKTDRLEFAKWITSTQNPLTARTFVNRVWEQLFGKGIVETVEDFGSQGALPSHPELLDELSYYWMHEQKWQIKSLMKTILLSKAYRQSARVTEKKLLKDPDNRWISRGPRVRLSAEQIRDQALAMSGLLSQKMYGPPVMPYQPNDIWQTPYNNQSWEMSSGEDRYRRAIYTMIKRSSVYPSMETFDMSQRQVCVSRRIRTNTPLQALVTLNDSVYVEASGFLAQRMQKEGGPNLEDQINYAYSLGMAQNIPVLKGQILQELYEKILIELESDTSYSVAQSHSIAMNTVANAILNLDEMLNK